ncbi:MAG: MarC family protein [Parachlamydiales bacterium]|nr:MarC family protein [Parachlamydiales bacterium]
MESHGFLSFPAMVVTIFFTFNSIGQVPVFIALLAKYDLKTQRRIIIRELLIAFFVLLLFILFGEYVLFSLQITRETIGIVGGILLFLIALDLLFPKAPSVEGMPHHEPLIVPLAVPGLAGPGSITYMMLYSTQYGIFETTAALFCAWIPSLLLLLASSQVKRFLGTKGVLAVEKLGGMIIAFIGVQILTNGVIKVVTENFLTK